MAKRSFYAVALCGVTSLVLAVVGLHFKSVLKGNALALYDLSLYGNENSSLAIPVEANRIAHAGGALHGLTYTNSREALDEHYSTGYRVFELDFSWTTDGRLVLIHDWNHSSTQFGVLPHVFSYDEFVKGTRRDGLHQLTFEDLRKWLRDHPDALIVTDTKDNNRRLLEYLGANGGDLSPQLIIQIYRLSELHLARQLRPRAVWLSVYKCSYPAWALSMVTSVDAFVIPVSWYARYSQPKLMAKTRFYVHSLSEDMVSEASKKLAGVYGIYVD